LGDRVTLGSDGRRYIRATGPATTLADSEKVHILAALEKCRGNRTHAAKLLDINLRTLRNKLKEYKLAGEAVVEEEAAEA